MTSGENLYLHNQNGDCVLVEATPDGYREKSRFTPPNLPKKKQAEVIGGCVCVSGIANGRLYIRDLVTLTAYDIKANIR
jgi:hypothetical protein